MPNTMPQNVRRICLAVVIFGILGCAGEVTYTDEWAVHMPHVDEDGARLVAHQHNFVYEGKIIPGYYRFKHRHVARRSTDGSPHHHAALELHPEVHWLEQQVVRRRVKRDLQFNDPKWPRMWYLNRGQGLDMNTMGAWTQGYTGRDVVVTILDDGIEKDHPDLKRNYDSAASYDVNDHDGDPQPRYDYTNENRHGTRCAGEVSAEANNHICSVGVAYDAKIGGVRMLDGDVTDAVEAESLGLNPQHIDIYSASWGPDDDGRTVDGPATMAHQAFINGITFGRQNKGNIFVWASGNGGRDGDSCNCDGYTNSIYTLSISSATENGHIPWYSEACSSTLATTYSSGAGGERQIVTTDLRKSCTETHTGTSASAPIAAGVCALALQANPNLTWRDMQHIVVLTARPSKLVANDWVVNGVDRKVSHHFGFGLMDATAMVERALNWSRVPQQRRCEVTANARDRVVQRGGTSQFTVESNGCSGSPSHTVNYVEHVQAVITLESTRRGDVQISLVSPKGTRSTLLARRSRDTSTTGFNHWPFMTTHSWGETSRGTWILEVSTGASTNSVLKNWSLVLYGTDAHPYSGSQQAPNIDIGYPPGKITFNQECVDHCDDNFFSANQTTTTFNQSQNATVEKPIIVCLPCYDLCTQCVGDQADECDACVQGYTLVNNTCISTPPPPPPLSLTHVTFVYMGVALCLGAVLLFTVVFMAFYFIDKRLYKPVKKDDTRAPHIRVDGIMGGRGDLANGRGLMNGGKGELGRALLEDTDEENDDQGELWSVNTSP